MPQPVKASDVPLREQGPLLHTTVVATIELRSLDEFVEAEKLIALRDLIENRVHSVEFEVSRDWMKPKPVTRRPAQKGDRPDLRGGLAGRIAALKEGATVGRDDLAEAAGGTWRQVAPMVRALVNRGVLAASEDKQSYTRTAVPL